MSFEALLTQISYKPGWRFEFHPPANVELRVATIDSWPPHAALETSFETSVWSCCDRDAFIAAVLGLVRQAEEHELREWFKVDGARWPDGEHSKFWRS